MSDTNKIKIGITGAAGHMGQILTKLAEEDDKLEVAALVDPSFDAVHDAMRYNSILDLASDEGSRHPDVIIDFSSPVATEDLIKAAKELSAALIIATTGQTEEQKHAITEAAAELPIFFSTNMSLGVALLNNLAAQVAEIFGTADIEIIETHHTRKVDSPSGTALTLAESVQAVRPELNIVCGRSGQSKREKNDLGISSIRIGDVVGIHEIFFTAGSQTISLKHEAHDRALFAEGAIDAAKFIVGKPAGLYNMSDIISGQGK